MIKCRKPLGADFKAAKNGLGAYVVTVRDDGTVAKWNDSARGGLFGNCVLPGDQLHAIRTNKLDSDGRACLRTCKGLKLYQVMQMIVSSQGDMWLQFSRNTKGQRPPGQIRSINVTLAKPLGIDICSDMGGTNCKVESIVEGGSAFLHNEALPAGDENRIQILDRLVAIKGLNGAMVSVVGNKLVDIIGKMSQIPSPVTFRLERRVAPDFRPCALEHFMELQLTAPLGLALISTPSGIGTFVGGVSEKGSAYQHNLQQATGEWGYRILDGDQITAIYNCVSKGWINVENELMSFFVKMLSAQSKGTELRLRFVRCTLCPNPNASSSDRIISGPRPPSEPHPSNSIINVDQTVNDCDPDDESLSDWAEQVSSQSPSARGIVNVDGSEGDDNESASCEEPDEASEEEPEHSPANGVSNNDLVKQELERIAQLQEKERRASEERVKHASAVEQSRLSSLQRQEQRRKEEAAQNERKEEETRAKLQAKREKLRQQQKEERERKELEHQRQLEAEQMSPKELRASQGDVDSLALMEEVNRPENKQDSVSHVKPREKHAPAPTANDKWLQKKKSESRMKARSSPTKTSLEEECRVQAEEIAHLKKQLRTSRDVAEGLMASAQERRHDERLLVALRAEIMDLRNRHLTFQQIEAKSVKFGSQQATAGALIADLSEKVNFYEEELRVADQTLLSSKETFELVVRAQEEDINFMKRALESEHHREAKLRGSSAGADNTIAVDRTEYANLLDKVTKLKRNREKLSRQVNAFECSLVHTKLELLEAVDRVQELELENGALKSIAADQLALHTQQAYAGHVQNLQDSLP